MTEKKTEVEVVVEEQEQTAPEPIVVKKVTVFSKLGNAIDNGFTNLKVLGKKHGKKVVTGLGIATGVVVAGAITGVALNVAAELPAAPKNQEEPIDVEPVNTDADDGDEGAPF